MTGEVSMAYMVVSAPMVMLPSPFSRIPRKSGNSFKSTMYFGSSPFSFIAMTRSVPPARKRPPGPLSLSSRLASARVVGW